MIIIPKIPNIINYNWFYQANLRNIPIHKQKTRKISQSLLAKKLYVISEIHPSFWNISRDASVAFQQYYPAAARTTSIEQFVSSLFFNFQNFHQKTFLEKIEFGVKTIVIFILGGEIVVL